jgi:lambda repressor-like predicted transcriptional regulator
MNMHGLPEAEETSDAELAQRLHAALRQRGTSLRSLSVALNIPYRTVQNYFSGQVKIPAIFVLKMARNQGIALPEIFPFIGEERVDDFAAALRSAFSRYSIAEEESAGAGMNGTAPSQAKRQALSIDQIAVVLHEEYIALRTARFAQRARKATRSD